jgi:hypothetical protein
MRRIRMLGACLLAVLTFSAMVGSSALAAPEFYNGTSPNTSTVPFIGKTGAMTLRGGTEEIQCTNVVMKGKVVGASDLLKVKFTYYTCETSNSHAICNNAAGRINTHKLKGELVDASENLGGPPIVGVRFEAEIASQTIATFQCGPTLMHWTGTMIALYQPISTASQSINLRFDEKPPLAGCGQQQLLYAGSSTTCEHLAVTPFGETWLVSDATDGTLHAALEVRP